MPSGGLYRFGEKTRSFESLLAICGDTKRWRWAALCRETPTGTRGERLGSERDDRAPGPKKVLNPC
jgi:hypothetical protein